MTITTPDVEADLIDRLAELVPAHFIPPPSGVANVWAGSEQQPDGAVPVEATFVRWYGEDRELVYGGQGRYFRCQILRRFARDGWAQTGRAAAMAKMRAIYDAVHLSGEWTTAGGVVYLDVRAIDFPAELEPAYFAMNVAVWHRG